jgi:hypothetical protein
MALLITVSPAGSGWTVQSAALDGDVIFASGAKAEAAGRSLADQVAESGRTAELRIIVRDGSLGGVFLYPSRSAPSALAG